MARSRDRRDGRLQFINKIAKHFGLHFTTVGRHAPLPSSGAKNQARGKQFSSWVIAYCYLTRPDPCRRFVLSASEFQRLMHQILRSFVSPQVIIRKVEKENI